MVLIQKITVRVPPVDLVINNVLRTTKIIKQLQNSSLHMLSSRDLYR